MRILILSQWYPPEPTTLKQAMAGDLVKRGHQVLSITGFPNYPSGKICQGYGQLFYYAAGMMSNNSQEKANV